MGIQTKGATKMNIDSMIQGNPQALVTSYNGVLVADSLEVADRFGKAHKNVVRDIENLMDGIEANRLNFEPIAEKEYFIPDFYTDKRNREQKRYKLTRDGFSLLVMGFTGPAALHWKLLYIEAFNKMEQALVKKYRNAFYKGYRNYGILGYEMGQRHSPG